MKKDQLTIHTEAEKKPAYNASTQGKTGQKDYGSFQGALDLSKYQYHPATDTAYQQALASLQKAQQQLPSYRATYDQQLSDLYKKIVDRDEFSYDVNKDALYQQYADQYTAMGQRAMLDTMGQAASLTGGYVNSFAQSVGQQTYQGYLQQLNDKVPELYGLALDQHNQEGQNLLNQYSMLGDMANTEYQRYQDALAQYWQNVSYQKQLADDAYNKGYTASRDAAGDAAAEYDAQYQKWLNDRNLQYQLDRDAVSDQQWLDSFAYQKEQDALAQQNWQTQFDYGKEQDALAQQNWQAQFEYSKAQDAAENGRWWAQFQYGKEQDAAAKKDSAYAKLASMISSGYQPTAAELNAVGMTRAQAEAYRGSNGTAPFGQYSYDQFDTLMEGYAMSGNADLAYDVANRMQSYEAWDLFSKYFPDYKIPEGPQATAGKSGASLGSRPEVYRKDLY